MSKIQVTEDGSHTLFSEMAGQTYHSSHGAVQESRHIFIDAGLNSFCLSRGECVYVSVLEIGFGTGLNALLTMQYAEKQGVKIDYTTIELYPLQEDVYGGLNYGELLGCEDGFLRLHKMEWDREMLSVTDSFAIRKCKSDIVEWVNRNWQMGELFDVVYFDAFSPDAQPELWAPEVFDGIYKMMKEGGVLTTYCAKGDVRRAMLAAGFSVEKLQGPPGKRHILRGVK